MIGALIRWSVGNRLLVDTLRAENSVRLNHFSAWLVMSKDLRWGSIDTGLVLVAFA